MKNQNKPIKILFDAGPIVNGKKSGVGYYTWGLIENLAKQYPDNIELVGHYFDFLARKKDVDLPQASNIRYRKTVIIPGKVCNMWRRIGLPLPFEFLVKERGDFHLFPGFLGWPSLFKTPSAPVVHDVTYLLYPEYVNGPIRHDLRTLMPDTINRASLLITNSRASEASIREHYGLGNKPVVIGHIPPVNALPITRDRSKEVVQNLSINKKYIFFISNLEPRKNIERLIQAYTQLREGLKQEYGLVLAGGGGWNNASIHAEIKRAQQAGNDIILTGYVDDEQRAALFTQAAAFIMPSIYEGFGMPLLEAMTYRTPIIASDIPVHREVALNAAEYCAPLDVSAISASLTKVLDDPSYQNELVEQGALRINDFSWNKVASDIYQSIDSVIQNSSQSK